MKRLALSWFALLSAGVVGCGAQIAEVLQSSDGGSGRDAGQTSVDSGTADDAQTQPGACAAAGGVCLKNGESAPPNHRQAGAGEPTCGTGQTCWLPVTSTTTVCKTDADCNEDPRLSTLLGKCFEGVCFCSAPTTKPPHVQPSGKCSTPSPPPCSTAGGTCRQTPATCHTGEVPGNTSTNMSCGDFVEAVCCFAATSCKGPSTFVCCEGQRTKPVVCVNGWRTCEGGTTPRLATQGCAQ